MRHAIALGTAASCTILLVTALATAQAPKPLEKSAGKPAPQASSSATRPKSAPVDRTPLWAQSHADRAVDPRRVVIDQVVAVVGSQIITLSALRRRAQPMERPFANLPVADRIEMERKTERAALNQMIDDIIVRTVAEKKALTVTESQIDTAFETLKTQNGLTRETMQKALADAHTTEEEYRYDIKTQLLRGKVFQALVAPRVTKPGISNEELSKLIEAESKVWLAEQRKDALVEVRW